MIKTNKLYHIGLSEDIQAKYALLPGNPGRVEAIARHLESYEKIDSNREYLTYRGLLCGESILVTSTGIGGASSAIAVEELYTLGVRNFIRIGTCGGMQPQVEGGDIVIATAAVRAEGTSREYVPIEYPAVSDFEVTAALASAAKKLNKPYHTGVVQSKDSFYGQHSPERMPVGYELESKWRAWIKAGCLASEMECAAIYTVAGVLGAKSGAVLSVVWNQERERLKLPNPEVHDAESAIAVAIDALKILIKGS
ncbi:MAG: Uridine phosphorylase [Firmicutes bacterium ADurb.Bin193]|nr:MAG: Uridine phosphorylase [Firmicutes bacterium ADurb.Bin193]